MLSRLLAGSLLLAIIGSAAAAQTPAETPAAAQDQPLRLFLDCQTRCDLDYLRTEIPYVDYVRDRQDADVHLLITSQGTGAGGSEFTLQFVGLRGFASMTDELRFSSGPTDSQDVTRQAMGRMIELGLARYLARTGTAQRLDLSLRPSAASPGAAPGGAAPAARDPWNRWVFRVSVGGFLSGESSYDQQSWNASLNANRTTAGWKNVLSLSMRSSESNTEVGDRTVTNRQSDRTASTLNVRSLSDHWSVGGRTNANRSTFLNRDLAVRAAPAIEYNLFPYSQSTRRQLTVLYSIGANQIQYDQETIFGKTSEALVDQTLTVSAAMTQRWGSVRGSLEGAHYFHDASKYHAVAFGNAELRLIRGLSLNFSGSAERIRDQLHLAAGRLTPEQILLRQRQIATSFRYFGNVSLSYSFGSVFSAVVNPRMGSTGGSVIFF